MGSYFGYRRRKAGRVTLLMSCILCGGWIHSLSFTDVIWVSVNGYQAILVSSQSRLQFLRPRETPLGLVQKQNRIVQVQRIAFGDQFPTSRWIDFTSNGAATTSTYLDANGEMKEIPSAHYGMFVVPLTLLSAFLLISRPRRQTKSRDPDKSQSDE